MGVEALTGSVNIAGLPIHESKLLLLMRIARLFGKRARVALIRIDRGPTAKACGPRFIGFEVVSQRDVFYCGRGPI